MTVTKKWWFAIIALSVVALCVRAGLWQLDRAHEKEKLIQILTAGQDTLSSVSDVLNAVKNPGSHRVLLSVERDLSSPFVYLDNRVQDRVPGYEVFTEVATRDGAVRFLVNMGWVPGMDRRAELPAVQIPSEFELVGVWVPVTDGYLMGRSQAERLGGPLRVQSLADIIGTGTLPGMIIAEGLLPRNSRGPSPRLGPETHYGYALQWFLLAVVLSGLTTFILKRGIIRG